MLFAGLELPLGFWIVIGVLAVWEGVWKLIAMWKAARKGSVVWFIVLAIFNTLGILPILYIYIFSERKMKSKKRNLRKKKRR
ncbi:hypothetical protein COU59_01345 [Candidatus Pacearchaeota archaeon CG10_big_fil_rev_8_21_14_0_10_34_12]|nr:MAG: hypothetical protein COU59_01345 [Candidatus Pacearchaeota archaeon CG10_big_fil_rev_8_21_14_0_10_34_12]